MLRKVFDVSDYSYVRHTLRFSVGKAEEDNVAWLRSNVRHPSLEVVAQSCSSVHMRWQVQTNGSCDDVDEATRPVALRMTN